MKKVMLVGGVFMSMVSTMSMPKNVTGKPEVQVYGVRQSAMSRDFFALRDALEVSGGQDESLQKQLCGLGIECLNQLRAQVLDQFPALKDRKMRVEIELSRVSREMERIKSDKGKAYKQLQSTKKKLTYKLNLIEDEIEAQLHNRPDLSAQFDKIHDVLKEWCD